MICQGAIKLFDFGLSKRIEEIEDSSDLTTPTIVGVIPYIDPKKFSSHPYSLNQKSDVYSVGVLLWVISSCQPPFYTEDKDYDIHLAFEILKGRREQIIKGTPVDYSKIYTSNYNF